MIWRNHAAIRQAVLEKGHSPLPARRDGLGQEPVLQKKKAPHERGPFRSAMPSAAQEAPSVYKGDTGPTIINCGVDAEYFERRLMQFRDMILLAMDINERIVWG